MEEVENIAGDYLSIVSESKTPAVELVSFYSKIFDLDFDKGLIPMFARLVRLYGRENLFYCIIESMSIPDINHSNVHRLYAYMCARKLKDKKVSSNSTDLTGFIEQTVKLIDKNKTSKTKVRNPFDEN